LDGQLLDAFSRRVDLLERLAGRLGFRRRRLQLHGGGLRPLRGLGRRVLRLLQLGLESGDVGNGVFQLPGAFARGAGLAPRERPRVVDRLDAEQPERHLLATCRAEVRERVELFLLRVDRRAEHVEIHV
jgi:hypothetical protein